MHLTIRRKLNTARRVAILAILLGGGVGLAVGIAAERVQITILSTTDLHGHILPVDYYTNLAAQDGIAKVGTLIRQIRQEQPNVLLLDSGDTIQGSPLAYFHCRKNNAPPDPTILAMNSLGYDAMTVGNHEFNFGRGILDKARREATFPWLSANTCRSGTDEPAFTPYVIREIAGVRIGILGLTTPAIPNWEDPPNYAGLEFRDPVTTARHWVSELRDREHVDLVVVPTHMGFERDLRTGDVWPGQMPDENAAFAVAEQVPGIDVILMGHTHRDVPMHLAAGVLFTQAGRWGDRLARVDVVMERDAGRWKVVDKASRTIPVTVDVAPDPAIVALAEPYDRETQAWLGHEIGECAASLSARESRLHDTAIMDLIHHVQLEAGQADISMAASFSLSAKVPAGKVTVRDIAGLYVYENTLVVLEVTGAQVKAALEQAAKYFRDYEPGKKAAELIDTRIPGYNFDMAEGVDYTIDLRKPVGSRIVDVRYQGAPIDPARKFRLAINNYRQNGGGGYSMYQGAPVLQRSSAEIRDLIITWVEEHTTIPAEPDNNWRIVTGTE